MKSFDSHGETLDSLLFATNGDWQSVTVRREEPPARLDTSVGFAEPEQGSVTSLIANQMTCEEPDQVRYPTMNKSLALFNAVLLLTNGAFPQTPKTDRELVGLKGKVRSVIAQHAKLAEDGKSLAGPQQLSYNEHYDEEGNLSERESFDYRGNISQKDVYSVIDGDKTAKSQYFHHDYDPPPPEMASSEKEQKPRDPRFSLKFKYKNDGNTVERIAYYNDGTQGTRAVSTYERGKRVKQESYDRDGKLNLTSVSAYGERGEELESTYYLKGSISDRYKYTDYEIDLRGNWIRRTMWISKRDNPEFRPYETQSRTITYFDDKATEAMAKSTPPGGDRPLVIRVNTGALADRAIKKIDPVLPPGAKGTKGEVLIEVSVDEQGNVASVEGVTGDRVLLDAAIAAVRQWKFDPTKLSGKPVRIIGRLRFWFNK